MQLNYCYIGYVLKINIFLDGIMIYISHLTTSKIDRNLFFSITIFIFSFSISMDLGLNEKSFLVQAAYLIEFSHNDIDLRETRT